MVKNLVAGATSPTLPPLASHPFDIFEHIIQCERARAHKKRRHARAGAKDGEPHTRIMVNTFKFTQSNILNSHKDLSGHTFYKPSVCALYIYVYMCYIGWIYASSHIFFRYFYGAVGARRRLPTHQPLIHST